jgi:subtilisin family serine protease
MYKKTTALVMISLILLSLVVMPATAASDNNEKVPVLINFKNKPDAELVKAHGGNIKYEYKIVNAIAAELPQKAIDALSKNPNIDFIEPDAQAFMLEDNVPWGISQINAPEVQSTGLTGAGVKIAIVDSGVDYDHPDLAANYLGGYDFVNNDADPKDDNSHGTHVAGTILAPDNGIGVLGAAPEADFFALKVLDASGYCYYSDVAAAIDWAVENNADIVTMSLGGSSYSTTMQNACDNAYSKGVVIVAAAGNTGTSGVLYPAAYDTVIAVAATDSNNNRASWSTYGSQIELSAPGVSVYSTMPNSGYGYKSGTSMATPHVAGAIALLLSTDVTGTNLDIDNDGKWDPSEVRARLQSTSTDLGTTGKDDYFGYGLVNVLAAVEDFDVAAPVTEEPVDPPVEEPPVSEPPVEEPPVDETPTEPAPTVTMYVSSLDVTSDFTIKAKKHVFAWATAAVIVEDDGGKPVSGATISGEWSGVLTSSVIMVTDTNGFASVTTDNLKNPDGSFIFTVTDITMIGYEFDSSVGPSSDSASI